MMVCQNVGLAQPGEVVGRQRFVHFRWIFIDSLLISFTRKIRLLQISDLENVLTRKFYFESENEKHTTIWKELEDDDV